jgi:iron(III) transport system ATP-binding protein
VSGIHIEGLRKTFAGKHATAAISELDLTVEDGELLVLLGPSGCGKTTTLRCVAGLETPDGGAIRFDDVAVFDHARRLNVPPEQRNIGMVFQSYALWPHMTVRANIGYPLRARRKKEELRRLGWVDEAAAMVNCSDLLDKYPGQLSGGQQQRVALARGLVARPDVVLLDEPLSNLDARLREQVRGELHDLHRRLGFTGIHVTHDQLEAFALGDRVAVMRAGKIEQLDEPATVYEHPATETVAEFVGLVNRIPLEPRDGSWISPLGALSGARVAAAPASGDVALRIRPENLTLVPSGASSPMTCLDGGKVVDAFFAGRSLEVLVDVGGSRLRALLPVSARGSVEPGMETALAFEPSDARLFVDGAAVRDV